MKTKLLTSGLFLLLIAGYFAFSEDSFSSFIYQGEKMKGLSFVAPNKPINAAHFDETERVNAYWVSLMPYGFVQDGEPSFRYTKSESPTKESHQWWGEQPNGVIECIRMAHGNGQKVMLKPHMWQGNGSYTGDFKLDSEEDWKEFELTFGSYILQYAKIAEQNQVELFCIATEMKEMVSERPEFWFQLIKDIKKVYSGALTYAENWDCFDDVPFWSELDFIGIDGYFPLSKARNPELKELKLGWKRHLKKMERISGQMQKPVLFTEYGFRSCDFSTEKPWETDYTLPDNEGLQARAYQSLYEEVWNQSWFAGGFVWKWFPFKDSSKSSKDKFCPQHKEAENVLREFYCSI